MMRCSNALLRPSYSSNTYILQELSEQHTENHQLLRSIQTSLQATIKSRTITKEMKQLLIVQSLKELFALDNPFDWTAVDEKVLAAEGSNGSSIITTDISPIISTTPVIGQAGAAEGSAVISPIEVIEKAGAAEGSPIATVISPIGLDVKACVPIP
jgi:hypothetical protein